MEDFVKNGKFDCIKIGQTKEYILHNFPDPDIGGLSMSHKDNIWVYGSFEFFFYKNILTQIYCEDLALFGGEGLKIDKWIFGKPLTLLETVKELNCNIIDFSLTHKFVGSSSQVAQITVSNSNVTLGFSSEEENERDCNCFRLRGISFVG